MATKGNQSVTALAELIEKSRLGQAEKAAVRRAKRNQKKTVMPIGSIGATITGEEALHALFSKTRKVIAENHVSRDPSIIVGNSRELRRAMALHGSNACVERMTSALIKSGYDVERAENFSRSAVRASL